MGSDLLFGGSSGLELIVVGFSVVRGSHLFVVLLCGLALRMMVRLSIGVFLAVAWLPDVFGWFCAIRLVPVAE